MEVTEQPCLEGQLHQLTNATVGGDSGAWIVDNATGAVCGHVTAWNERGSYGILAPMEVMLHDMERTLKKSVALPTTTTSGQCTYHEQMIACQSQASANECDEAVDLNLGSRPTSPYFDEALAADHAIGQQFVEQSISDSTQASTVDTSEFDLLEGTSVSTSPAVATSPPPPTRTLEELKLDDVADRWTRSQVHKQSSNFCERKATSVARESSVQPGLKAQC